MASNFSVIHKLINALSNHVWTMRFLWSKFWAIFISSLWTADVFKRLNLVHLLLVHLLVQLAMAVAFLVRNGVLILVGVAALGYTLAKISPRFYGNLMRNLGNTQIGLVLGLINSVSLTLPVVTIAFFGTISATISVQISWGIYALLTIVLFIPLASLHKNINAFEK